ncbi:MAG: glycosyltransferase [Pseudonocardiaceae bacterium]
MNLLRRRVRRAGPLRVMYVVPDLVVGGAERHVTTLLPALDRARFSPSVVCIGQPGELFDTLVAGGVPARALHRPKRQLLGTLSDLLREMRRTRPDIVITRGYNAEMLGRIAAILTRVPRTIVWVHNSGGLAPRTRVRRLADRMLNPLTSAYYGVARSQLSYLTSDLGYPTSKVRIVRNGVDTSRPVTPADPVTAVKLGIGPGDPVIGILAALRPEKDHATLLRAARLVLDELPATRILVVGDGMLRPELQRLASELGIADQVIFTGSRSDVGDLLALMDVFTLTSYSECLPMAVLEAMVSGRPAVCTAVGGIPELIEDGVTGHLVPPRDPQALARQLVTLLGDRERACEMGRAARTRVEAEFSFERFVRDAGTALEETAGRIRPGRDPIRLTVVLDVNGIGGAEIQLLTLFRRFDPAVVNPKVVSLRNAAPLADEFRASGFPVEVIGRGGRYDLRTLPRLMRQFRRDTTDVVMVANYQAAALTLGRLAARLAGVRANIVAVHNMDLTGAGRRCLPRHDVETLFLSDALVLLASSQGRYLHGEEGVGRFPWRRIPEVVIPNGIELPGLPSGTERPAARRQLGVDPEDFVVGVVARLTAEKAHDVLFEAVAKLAPSHLGLRLVVVGDGARETQLRELAGDLGIADRVLFTGLRRDVPELLPGFDVSCLSSVREAAPISVIESMAAGLPVVATGCGAIPDMVADGEEGFIVPVNDSGAIADRIARLAADPALRTAQGARARARAERDYRIEATAESYQRLLISLVMAR